jgi:hypothetical protein
MSGTRKAAIALGITLVALAVGCGDSADAVDPEAIEGTWTYELSREYMLENGISEEQAKNESGAHTAVLRDGNFSDSWRTAEGTTGTCSGKYVAEGAAVTFYWKRGCFGDWKMTPTLDDDQLTWSDMEALPPHDSDEDQKINEVFNSVPWTRATASG